MTKLSFAPDTRAFATTWASANCMGYFEKGGHLVPDCAPDWLDVWDSGSGTHRGTLHTATPAPLEVEWLTNDRVSVWSRPGTGGHDLRIWDAESLRILYSGAHYLPLQAVDAVRGRLLLADGEVETQVHLIDLATGNVTRPRGTDVHNDVESQSRVSFSRDGRRLHLYAFTRGLELLDPTTLRVRALAPDREEAKAGILTWIAEQPETERTARLYADGTLEIWGPTLTLEATIALPGERRSARIAWAGVDRLLVSDFEGPDHLVDVPSRSVVRSFHGVPGPCAEYLRASPDGSTYARTRSDCSIDVLDRALTVRFSLPQVARAPGARVVSAHAPQAVLESPSDPPLIAWSPDGTRVAALSYRGALDVYATATGIPVARLALPPLSGELSLDLVWSPDSRFVGLAAGDLTLLEVATGKYLTLRMLEVGERHLPVAFDGASFDAPPELESCADDGSLPARPRNRRPDLRERFFRGEAR